MKKLKIEIETNDINEFDYQLDRIKQQIKNGFTSGENWHIKTQNY